jgi:hypothetical protein
MLTTAEVQRLRVDHGPNALPAAPLPRAWLMLAKQLTHFFALLLWAAAALATLAGMPAMVFVGLVTSARVARGRRSGAALDVRDFLSLVRRRDAGFSKRRIAAAKVGSA